MSSPPKRTACTLCGAPFSRWVRFASGAAFGFWCENCDAHGSGCNRQHGPGQPCVYPHPRPEDLDKPAVVPEGG